jgi:hypothetical protein
VVIPKAIRGVVIAADRDPPDAQGRCPGQNAACAAVDRFRREGRLVSLKIPDEGDFNDVLLARRSGLREMGC